MKLRIVAGMTVFSGLFGCMPMTPVVMQNSFNQAEAEYIFQEGPHMISGQSFMRTNGGDVRTCAGMEVSLVPQTAYSTERMRLIYGNDFSGFRGLHLHAV